LAEARADRRRCGEAQATGRVSVSI
jgi:hypothetical protein